MYNISSPYLVKKCAMTSPKPMQNKLEEDDLNENTDNCIWSTRLLTNSLNNMQVSMEIETCGLGTSEQ